jgi:hypothetical protein
MLINKNENETIRSTFLNTVNNSIFIVSVKSKSFVSIMKCRAISVSNLMNGNTKGTRLFKRFTLQFPDFVEVDDFAFVWLLPDTIADLSCHNFLTFVLIKRRIKLCLGGTMAKLLKSGEYNADYWSILWQESSPDIKLLRANNRRLRYLDSSIFDIEDLMNYLKIRISCYYMQLTNVRFIYNMTLNNGHFFGRKL